MLYGKQEKRYALKSRESIGASVNKCMLISILQTHTQGFCKLNHLGLYRLLLHLHLHHLVWYDNIKPSGGSITPFALSPYSTPLASVEWWYATLSWPTGFMALLLGLFTKPLRGEGVDRPP